jgi:hypothetical protein
VQKKRIPYPQKARLRDYRLVEFSVYCSGVPPLHATPFGGPVRKALQLVAVLPGQLKKFGCGHVRRFFAKKRLKPPL